jgi:tetratricopeptide (TPR) repeat protein
MEKEISTTAKLYYNSGNDAADKGNYEEAVKNYSEAIRLEPNYANAYFNRGDAYDEIGEYDKAIADYSEVIRIEKSADAYLNRGVVFNKKGENDRAIVDLTEAIRLDPNCANAYRLRNEIYKSNGESEVIRASDEDFDIPQSDLPLSIEERLFVGFTEMSEEKKIGLESRKNELVKEHQKLTAEMNSLISNKGNISVYDFQSSAKKLCTLSEQNTSRFDMLGKKIELFKNSLLQPIEKQAEAYYNWLVEKLNAAKSTEEYTALANKFSDISEYKNCAALAETCTERAITLAITKLDEEYKPRFDNIDRKMQMPSKPFLYSLFTSLQKNYDKKVQLYEQELPELNKQKSALRSEYEKKKEEIIKNYQSL